MLEVRKTGNSHPFEQYAWSGRYLDAPVVRWQDADDDGNLSDPDETLYYLTDANMNVTCLADTAGSPRERYAYEPYGQVAFLPGDWSGRSSSAYANDILYCGYRHDTETGLYHVRNRSYHPTLGNWVQRDPVNQWGASSLYEYCWGSPAGYIDWFGLDPEATTRPAPTTAPATQPANPAFQQTLGKLVVTARLVRLYMEIYKRTVTEAPVKQVGTPTSIPPTPKPPLLTVSQQVAREARAANARLDPSPVVKKPMPPSITKAISNMAAKQAVTYGAETIEAGTKAMCLFVGDDQLNGAPNFCKRWLAAAVSVINSAQAGTLTQSECGKLSLNDGGMAANCKLDIASVTPTMGAAVSESFYKIMSDTYDACLEVAKP